MQQSSATQSLHLSFWGLWKIVACSHSSSQCLLVSTVFGTVSSLHPTSFLMIFTLVYIAFTCVYNIMVLYRHSHECIIIYVAYKHTRLTDSIQCIQMESPSHQGSIRAEKVYFVHVAAYNYASQQISASLT